MKRAIAATAAAILFTFGSASVVMAQDTEPVTEEATDDGDMGLWGLAGLLGLAGLAGLKRRDTDYRNTRDVNTRA